MTSGWLEVRLGDLCTFQNGGTPSRAVPGYFEGDIPWLTGADITGPVAARSRSFVSEAGVKASAACVVPPGTVLLVTRTGVGKVAIAGRSVSFSQDITALHPDSSQLDSGYLVHFLRTQAASFNRKARGATIRGITREVVATTLVPLPPLQEQRRIAAVLDQADELRAKHLVAQSLDDALRAAVLADVVGDPRTNPNQWPIVPIASVVDEGDRINYGVVQPGPDVTDGVPMIRVSDLLGGKVRHDSLKRIAPEVDAKYGRSRIRGNEVLVSCVGSIGVVALVSEREKGFNIARAVARVPLSGDVSARYIVAYLASPFAQEYFVRELRTVAQPTLNIKQITELPLLLPPAQVQQKFEQAMAAIGSHSNRSTVSSRLVNELFASLQQRAFAGQL